MKLEQQQQAQHLYFQSDLSKTEIAAATGISRRTLHQWIRQNNWDVIKKAGEYIPAFIAGNCYQILGNYTTHLLSEERKDKPLKPEEANAIYKMTLTIGKLKTRPALNESMETLARFTDSVYKKSPEMAQGLQPWISNFLTEEAQPEHLSYRPANLTEQGHFTAPDQSVEDRERQLDEADEAAWAAEAQARAQQATANATPPAPTPTQQQPASQTAPAPTPALPSPASQTAPAPTPALPSPASQTAPAPTPALPSSAPQTQTTPASTPQTQTQPIPAKPQHPTKLPRILRHAA